MNHLKQLIESYNKNREFLVDITINITPRDIIKHHRAYRVKIDSISSSSKIFLKNNRKSKTEVPKPSRRKRTEPILTSTFKETNDSLEKRETLLR